MLRIERRGGSSIRQPAVPILMYHEISAEFDPSFRKYVVSPRAFARQMQFLRVAGYTPITMDTLLTARTSNATLPTRPVLITFDDGFDGVRYAADVLRSQSFPATFFLVAGLMGQTSEWEHDPRRRRALVDWTTARELVAAGFTCGAHSLTHPKLASLPAPEIRRELQQSRRMLEDRLGDEVVHFAYPFGSFDMRVRALVAEAGYRTACTVEIGLSTSQDHPLALRRVPITGHDTLVDFVARLGSGRSTIEWTRSVVRRLRRPEPGRDSTRES